MTAKQDVSCKAALSVAVIFYCCSTGDEGGFFRHRKESENQHMTEPSWDAHNESTALPLSTPLVNDSHIGIDLHFPQEDRTLSHDENTTLGGMLTTETTPTPLHLGVPYRVGFLLASTVTGLSSVSIKQVILPVQVSMMAPHSTNTAFALVSVVGALAGLLASPLTGALADRTTSRWGRRKPWITAGIAIGLAGLLIMAWAPSILMLVCGEILEQIGIDTVYSNVTALIPDQMPVSQRATTSAINGMAPVVGGVVGLLLVMSLTNVRFIAQGYLLVALISLLSVGSFLLVLRERPIQRSQVPTFHLSTFLMGFVQPLRSRDFTLTLLSRLLIYITYTVIGSYLLYYIRDDLHAPMAMSAHGVTTFQLISTVVLIITALLAGWLSRRIDRIKPFVSVGALLMAVGVGVIVAIPTLSALFIAGAIFGGGLGLYLGVDIALTIRVLPSAGSQGKDIGLIYTAVFCPLIITPILGMSILNTFQNNFAILFIVAALCSVLAAVLIRPIRSVR